MFNMIKMDLYRLLHTFSTKVMVFVVVVIILLMTLLINWDIRNIQADSQVTRQTVEETAEPEQSEYEEVVIGFSMDTNEEWARGNIELGGMIGDYIGSAEMLLLISIFVTLFVNAEHKNGYIKNIVGQLPDRGMLILSKLVAVTVQVFILFALYVVSIVVFSHLFLEGSVYVESFPDMFRMLGVQFLLHLGFGYLILFLCMCTGSSGFSMTTGILLCTGVGTLVYTAINKGVNFVFPAADFDFSKLMLETNVMSVNTVAPAEQMIRACVVALVYIAVCGGLSMVIFRKRDIR